MADNTKTKGVIVVDGAKVKCSLGSLSESTLKVQHKADDKYFVNKKKIATWREEDQKHMNFGTCKRSNPQPPCIPNISWSDYYENAEFGNQKILINQSQGQCQHKGTVTIVTHGQTSQPSSRIYKADSKDSYEIFMISPQVAATKGKKMPKVSQIDLVALPPIAIPATREVAFEIGGDIKNIRLIATVGKNDDKSLVSWAFYKGDNQQDRTKSLLEHGSVLDINLEILPEGKTTIYGYGSTPTGEATKIIINRKHNELEGINLIVNNSFLGNTVGIPKKTPIIFTPKYTFPYKEKTNNFIYNKQIDYTSFKSLIWRIKDDKGTILYTNSPGYSGNRKNSLINVDIINNILSAIFHNSGTYVVELEDPFMTPMKGILPDTKTRTVVVKARSANSIKNNGASKIRKDDLIHLTASGIQFDYAIAGLGDRAFWHIQKDNGKTINLGLRKEVKMKIPQLIEEFRKQQVIISNPYGNYKFQIDGEEKNVISIGASSDTAIIEVGKNRMESIKGPEKIPVGAVVAYTTKALMSLVPGENIRWGKPDALFSKFDLSPDGKEATLQIKQPGKVHFSAYLEGAEVSDQPIKKTVEASYISLEKALWCYANAKRRAETGWEEENYLHISLEGIGRTPIKIKVWAEHPELEPEQTFTREECLLKEIDTTLNEKGSCQVSFIADKEIKEKIQKINPDPTWRANLIFTLEFIGAQPLDLSNVALTHKQTGEEVHVVVSGGKTLYRVLDPGESLQVPASPRITAINFSNEAADDLQVGPTKYGIIHHIWINTVGMAKEILTTKVYKILLPEDMEETYDKESQAFATSIEVKTYDAEEVGTDGLLDLQFTPKESSGKDPEMFFVKVFSEKEIDGKKQLVEVGSQLETIRNLPFDKVFNKDCSQVGIEMPTLEEGQEPTAEQLKKIVSKFFHFKNPLYVSKNGTLEDQQVISPVLVERGESQKTSECPRCKADITINDLETLFPFGDKKLMKESLPFINEYFKLLEINTCRRKAHFFAQVRVETGFNSFTENLNYSYENLLSSDFKYYRGNVDRCKTDAKNPKAIGNNAYNGRMKNRMNTDDGYNFRGRGLIQTTGRDSYTKFQKFYDKNREKLHLETIIFASTNFTNETPDRLSEPRYAVLSGIVDWVNKQLNNLADDKSDIDAVDKITAIINKHTTSYPKRKASYIGGKWTYTSKDGKKTYSGEYKSGSRTVFKVEECGKVDELLNFNNSDLKIQKGIEWLLNKAIDQSEVNKVAYKVPYANDYDTAGRTGAAGENKMDCSELVCRFLQKIEWSKEVKWLNTMGLYQYAQKNSKWLQIQNNISYKPQKGDIFIWGNLNGGMGHTGIVIDYEEVIEKDGNISEVVTTIEAISSTEKPYKNDKITMKGVTKLKWLRASSHLIGHPLTKRKEKKDGTYITYNLTPCRFYTPLVHYTKK